AVLDVLDEIGHLFLRQQRRQNGDDHIKPIGVNAVLGLGGLFFLRVLFRCFGFFVFGFVFGIFFLGAFFFRLLFFHEPDGVSAMNALVFQCGGVRVGIVQERYMIREPCAFLFEQFAKRFGDGFLLGVFDRFEQALVFNGEEALVGLDRLRGGNRFHVVLPSEFLHDTPSAGHHLGGRFQETHSQAVGVGDGLERASEFVFHRRAAAHKG